MRLPGMVLLATAPALLCLLVACRSTADSQEARPEVPTMETMELPELINKCWAEHDSDPEGMAALLRDNTPLVKNAMDAVQYSGVFLHLVGSELGDWSGAAEHLENIVADLEQAPELALVLVQVAVANKMAGAEEAAGSALERAMELAPEPKQAIPARVQLLVSEAKANAGAWPAALELHAQALATVRGGVATPGLTRTLAVCSNNMASALLEAEDRDCAQTDAMVQLAEAAREAWLEAGGWMEDERADYLLALVLAEAGNPTAGLMHAERGLATIAAHEAEGGEPVDQAFLNLARARALRALERPADQAAALETAQALAAEFSDGLREWFDTELAKSR
ncbi:MAG: hypothetical protein QF599_02500 [Planctomycetota bacterium]|nr:hypothetical protein [Planctomycetota bacterium]